MTTDNALAAIVNPLEWALAEVGQHFAKPFGETYRIREIGYDWFLDLEDEWIGSWYKSLDEAKSAAQDHYAARVLSALDPVFLARVEKLEAENATLLRLLEERDDIIARDPELWTKFVATLPIQGGKDGE